MNFYKHFLGDYSRDTAHLSMLEHGAYRLMLDHYYATGKGLPADKTLLYRVCKASSKTERAAVDLVVDSFFPVNGDGSRHNKRADKEIGQWTAQAEINRELGKRGGRPKKTESVSQSVNESEPNQEPNRNPSHSHSQKPERTNTSPALPDWLPENAWNSYLEMRKKLRKAPTDRAIELIIAKLLKLKGEGHSPAGVLEQSVRNSWQDIFPLRDAVNTSGSMVKRAGV